VVTGHPKFPQLPPAHKTQLPIRQLQKPRNPRQRTGASSHGPTVDAYAEDTRA